MQSEDWIALLKHMGTTLLFFTLVWNVRVKKPAQRRRQDASVKHWRLGGILLSCIGVSYWGFPVLFELGQFEQILFGVVLLVTNLAALFSAVKLAQYWFEWRQD